MPSPTHLQPTSSAYFSECRKYRYWLTRSWDTKLPELVFVGFNPSDADEVQPDRTVTRCVKLAKRLEVYGGIRITNLFARVSKTMSDLLRVDDPVGPENEAQLHAAATGTGRVVVAWGTSSPFPATSKQRILTVLDQLLASGKELKCLRVVGALMPGHPSRGPDVSELLDYPAAGFIAMHRSTRR